MTRCDIKVLDYVDIKVKLIKSLCYCRSEQRSTERWVRREKGKVATPIPKIFGNSVVRPRHYLLPLPPTPLSVLSHG